MKLLISVSSWAKNKTPKDRDLLGLFFFQTLFVIVLFCAIIAVQANPATNDESIVAQQQNNAAEDGAQPENSFRHILKKLFLLG